MNTRQKQGKLAEELAAKHLEKHGLKLLTRNFRCPLGEIDLVAQDNKTIVFVEVRSRSTASYGSPQESVARTKQKRLTRLARWYLKQYDLEKQPARFDVIAIIWQSGHPQLTWIVNAFDACD